jgi:RNase P subunit RPR2
MARARERGEQRDVALERVRILFAQALELARDGDVGSASKRVRAAMNICTRCNVRVPREYKPLFCRKCMTIHTSETMRCRLNPLARRIERRCLTCGRVAVQPYLREKKRV